jgi:uncharacterized protein (TIGR03435 family)
MKTALIVVAAAGLLNAPSARAQSATPKFEVASIKPCEAGDRVRRDGGGSSSFSPGRLNLPCLSVKGLIDRAYAVWTGVRLHVWPLPLAIEGGPHWISSAYYRIEAKAEGPQTRGAMNGPMLEALLEDRFKLRVHRETREAAVYALTVAKGGPTLEPFRQGSCTKVDFDALPPPPKPGQPEPVLCGMSDVTANGYTLNGTTLADFATEFSGRLDRPVIDRTGIAGLFTIHLDLSPTELYPPQTPAETPDSSAVFNAVRSAVRSLGLRLDPAKGPAEFLVIDRVERPSEN